MAYFPFFMNISDKSALIVGGGIVALRKIEKLLPYGPKINVIAPKICEDIRAISGLELTEREFEDSDVAGRALVIAATDDKALNYRISALCSDRNIPVNVVDDKAACTFLFPSLIKRGNLSIGISTGGASPSAAIYLKNRINELLPEKLPEMLTFLDGSRDAIKAAIPSEKKRSELFAALFTCCLNAGRVLTEEEFQFIMQDYFEEGDNE